MKIAKYNLSLILAMGAVAALGACSAVPRASPNAAASAAAPPAALATQAAAPPLATKPTVGQEASAVANNHVDIDFPEGGATLTQEANRKLDLAARLFRDANPVAMFTTGHTDRRGDEYANVLLSARRAEAVKKALVARGIPADRLLIQALGETDLANSSDPYSAENRRVTITWRLL
jgi:OOP family OmpA-OmpF porin